MVGVWNAECMKLLPGCPECLHWFRSKSSDETFRATLFVYQHMTSKKFMLGRWLREHHVFLPVMELGAEPKLTEEIVAKFLSIVRPAPEQTAAVALKEASDNQQRQDEDHDAENREIRAQLLRDECGIKTDDRDGRVFVPAHLL